MNSYPRCPDAHDLYDPQLPVVSSHARGVGSCWSTYEVVDLSERPDLVEQLRSEGLLQAPILDDGTSRSAGFRPDRIRAIVDAATPARLTARGAQVHVSAPAAKAQAHRGREL